MMKNEYNAPKMELIALNDSDIIVTSGGFAGLDDEFARPAAPSFLSDLNQNF